MARVYVSTVIHAPVNKVWDLIGDYNSLPAWHPFVTNCNIEDELPSGLIGCVRAIEVKDDGGTIRERLVTLSDEEHLCRYSILTGPLAVRNYLATMWLLPVTTSNDTFAQWEANFDTDPADEVEMVDLVTSIFSEGFASVEEKLGKSP
ncbi:MAG TPA: SRPBCC family protein [Pirellulaceae bacterium]|nr:SRPBCC family protein [Pirellulaceae bacterium]